MSDMKRLRVDSATMAVDVKGLRLNVEEYKRLRRGDAEKIKAMGVKLRRLKRQPAMRWWCRAYRCGRAGYGRGTRYGTAGAAKVEMITPHIRLTGLIEDSCLKGEIRVPVTPTSGDMDRIQTALAVLEKGKSGTPADNERQSLCGDQYTEYIQIEK